MKQLILAHAPLATAFQCALQDITGKNACYALDLLSHMSPSEYSTQIETLINDHPKEKWLVWVDMAGGTPFNVIAQLSVGREIQVVTGVNLPALLHFSNTVDGIEAVEAWLSSPTGFGIKSLRQWLGGVELASQD